MTRLMRTILLTTMTSAAIWAGPSLAQVGEGKEGSGEAPRGASIEGELQIGGDAVKVPELEEGAARAAPMLDEAAAVKSFSVLTRSSDGKVTRSDPTNALKSIVIKSLGATAPEKKSDAAPQSGPDPAFTEGDEASRQVFGPDDRVQVANTKVYPYTTFGYINMKAKAGYGGCSGTLIGPRTVLTAAHCLYSHEDGDWLSEILYIPSLNGATEADAPFGAFPAESVSIVEGYVSNYKGTYDSVVPYDLGVITLADPLGDYLGYLAFSNFDDLGDFDAQIVGYPGDKPGGTMWRASCRVIFEHVGPDTFAYDCDTFPGSSGSAVYFYHMGAKQRIVTGVNVAESAAENTAVRLNAAYMEWVKGQWK